MSECPACGHENIDGADYCEECSADLFDIGLPESTYQGLGQELINQSIMDLEPELDVTVSPEDTVQEVTRTMSDRSAGAVMVLFRGELVGIFTERDFLTKIADEYDALASRPIREFMTPNPEYLQPHHSIAMGLNCMAVKKYRHVPILKEDKSVVCIRVRDVLKFLVKRFAQLT